MKKILLLALATIMMVGYDQQKLANSIQTDDFCVCIYDSCEYIIGIQGYKGFLAHKGNCRFCAERRKQELQTIIKQ